MSQRQPDYETLRAAQARAQEGHVQRVEHGLATVTTYSATCICGHVERSTIRYAAHELYLVDHIKSWDE